ncbi:MAG TPA: DinB family protein [Candidatus Limnocylindrales bacterium]|nr:DinB family protein [Candidatus Limnocylindrales bacterium]
MTNSSIRPAYPSWPSYNARLRELVAGLGEEQLAIQPTADRWPLWASIGHMACQRVFWLCVFAGAPGEDRTPFPNSGYDCPGDDDLEHVWSAARLPRHWTPPSGSSSGAWTAGRSSSWPRSSRTRNGSTLSRTRAAGRSSACSPTTSGTSPS